MRPRLRKVRLDNGFRALLIPRRGLPVVASSIWYSVGSRDERTGETGLSHFLEHMMFKGTDRYRKGEIDLLTSKMGGSNNAFTSHDVTAYYFALANDRWDTALEIEASRMRDCTLDPAEFEAEKSVVLEELAMGEDDPWGRLYQALEGLTFQVHPYHHPIIGWRQDVESVSADAMRAYYHRHYGANRALMVVCGDIDVRRTADRVAELFGDLPPAEERATVLAEPTQVGARRADVAFPTAEPIVRLTIAYPTCRMGEDDDFALDVLSSLLTAHKTGRLYKRLVLAEQLASHVSTTNEVRLDPGLFCVTVELHPGADPDRAEAVIREELDRVASRGATAAELRRIRMLRRSAFLFEEETALGVAMRLGRFETTCDDGLGLLDSALARYDKVRSSDLQRVTTSYLGRDRENVCRLMPVAPPRPKKGRRR